jgi:transcriptional regulator with XRE-family HTH domain
MDPRRFGRVLRAIRLESGETQAAVSERAQVSQTVYSRAERGMVSDLKVGTLDRIASALDADLIVTLRFQGGRADRLIDRAHASIVELVVAALRSAGWQTHVEFSFNVFGERGSVDVLGWHAPTRTLLIVEVKSRFTDLQEMLLSLGRKLRLVPDEVRRELGWDAASIGRIVVAPGTTENRAILDRHPSIFRTALPARAIEIRGWIREPSGPIAGVWLVSRDVIRKRVLA